MLLVASPQEEMLSGLFYQLRNGVHNNESYAFLFYICSQFVNVFCLQISFKLQTILCYSFISYENVISQIRSTF